MYTTRTMVNWLVMRQSLGGKREEIMIQFVKNIITVKRRKRRERVDSLIIL